MNECLFPGNGTLITTGAPALSLLEVVEEVASPFQSLAVISLLSLLRSPTTDDLTAAPTQLVTSDLRNENQGEKTGDFISLFTIDSKPTCYVCSQACFGNPKHHWCTSSLTSRGCRREVASPFQSLTVISLLSSLRLPTTDDLTAAPTQLVISLILKTYETKTRGKKLVILFLDLQLTQNQRAMCVHRRVLETLDQIDA